MAGTTVKRFTNKEFLIQEHEITLEKVAINRIQAADGKGHYLLNSVTSEIRSSPHTSLNANNRVDIKTITRFINQPMDGKFLLCRSICPPFKMIAVGTVVDDPDGELCVRLSMYNFIKDTSSRSSIESHLPVGSILAIKNPWFKTTADGGISVRCDNPTDVVILNQSTLNNIFPNLKWNGDIPLKYQRKELTTSAVTLDWKRIGNEHFVGKRYQEAVSAYTNGLEEERKSVKERVDVLANRSAAYLALEKYKLALTDAEWALAIDESHIKCIYRKTKALFGLALYAKALEFLNKIPTFEESEKQKIINDLLCKVKSFIVQSENGVYPWEEIFKMSRRTLDLAEFKGPVVVKQTQSKGRGLFATRNIKAGQLILGSKAFAYVVDKDPNEINMNVNIETRRMKSKDQAQLVSSVIHILKENPDKCAEVYGLYAGPEMGNLVYEEGIDAEPLYDMKRIDAICSYNAFGTGNRMLPKPWASATRQVVDWAGLWITPSYINHSCVDANVVWIQIENFIFIRAFRDIQSDEEILSSYQPINQLISQKNLDSYSFVCDCRLCVRDRQDNVQTQADRAFVLTELDYLIEKYSGSAPVLDVNKDGAQILHLLKSFNKTRKDAPELNLCLVTRMMKLCGCYYFRNQLFLDSANQLIVQFKMIENVAVFWYISLEVCINIIAAFIHGRQIPKAQKWLKIFKARATSFYGTWTIIYTQCPSTVELMKKFDFDL